MSNPSLSQKSLSQKSPSRHSFIRVAPVLALLAATSAPPAQAALPVIDVAAIAQAIKQVEYWRQQITGMQNQLGQLRSTYDAMTGSRGMQALLPISLTARNYLPEDWAALEAVMAHSSTRHAGLSTEIQRLVDEQAVLSDTDLSRLAPAERRLLEARRRSNAMLRVMTLTAYGNASQRFASLQTLISAIGTARDPKAIADLQGRIGVEQAMLENEQTKLETLYQSAQAEQWSHAQQAREQALAGIGRARSLPAVSY